MISDLKKSYSIITLCKTLSVNRSSYKYWLLASDKINAKRIEEKSVVKRIFNESGGSAGSRTIATIAQKEGHPLSRYRVRGLMMEAGLHSRQYKRHGYKKATQPHISIKNHLNRQFDVKKPNQVWCGDVTYLWIGTRWAYLSVVMDLFSRKPIGWALSYSPDSQLTAKALDMAFVSRGQPKNVMFHSDQGCHYMSSVYRERLEKHGIQQSMSRRGNCWDNAPMERFFRSFKSEWMPKYGYSSFDEAKQSVKNYITGYYSTKRPHAHNDGKTPNEKESLFLVKSLLKGG